ncbi:TadE/TadG family type IV pilus assembly protein [Acidocella sp.]|uniref:TadE/TadG family type IV pilus assembly protein n=1 Tax=Acidocella sp. TaxID=50710 RepID=UPI003CFF6ED8
MRQYLLRRTPRRGNGRRGAASVEFSLVAVLFLLPLIAGSADFIAIITARAQLNTALQALQYYAWANQSQASNITSSTTTTQETALISAIDSTHDTFQITLNAGSTSGSYSTLVYACVNSTASPVSISGPYSSSSSCSSGQTVQTYVQFTVSAKVNLPFPLPVKLTSPYSLRATGAAQVS